MSLAATEKIAEKLFKLMLESSLDPVREELNKRVPVSFHTRLVWLITNP